MKEVYLFILKVAELLIMVRNFSSIEVEKVKNAYAYFSLGMVDVFNMFKVNTLFIPMVVMLIGMMDIYLVFWNAGSEYRLRLSWDQGQLRSDETGKYIHPYGGRAGQDTLLCFHGDRGGA